MSVQQGFTGPVDDRRLYSVDDITSYRRGGIGVVFEGSLTADRFDSPRGVQVGLKMLTAIDRQRYDKLAERSAQLRTVNHPHLARHVECFIGPAPSASEHDEDEFDNFFSVHEWIDGTPLSETVANRPPLDILKWAHEIADGLGHLHTRPGGGFAHRDVHSRNVIIAPDESAILIDFDTILWGDPADTNIVSLSSSSGGVRRGLIGAQASDIQALASLILRGLAADPDGAMTLDDAVKAAHLRIHDVARDSVGVLKVLQLAIDAPPTSVGQLMSDVQRAFDRRPSPVARVRRTRRSSRRVIAGAVAAVVLVAGGGAAVWALGQDNTRSPQDPGRSREAASTVELTDVAASDLPTLSQVADIYNTLAGGSRDDREDRGANSADEASEASEAVESGECSRGWTVQFRSVTGLTGSYDNANQESPFSAGEDSPSVSVYQFSSEANAEAAAALFAKFGKRCKGVHQNTDGSSKTYSIRLAPAGFSMLLEEEKTVMIDENENETLDDRWWLELVSRKGAYVIRTFIQSDAATPDVDRAIELAKIAHAMAGEST